MTIDSVIVDIEGTTGSISYVHDVLFPYSAKRLPDWVAAHAEDAEVAAALAQTAALADRPAADRAELVSILLDWIEQDVKATPLKTIQGRIWAAGYAAGELVAHVYDDVPVALRAWTEAGRSVFVYSSGSVLAQQQWFGHTAHGDLRPYFAGYFDTVNAGPKREAASYRRIAESIGGPAERLLFASDVGAELDAARSAGWHTVGVRRPGGAPVEGEHEVISSFTGYLA